MEDITKTVFKIIEIVVNIILLMGVCATITDKPLTSIALMLLLIFIRLKDFGNTEIKIYNYNNTNKENEG